MESEYVPIFIEKKNGFVDGAWVHDHVQLNAKILPLAYTSDLGILRLIVSDLDAATGLLKKEGFIVRQSSGAVEVIPEWSRGLQDILLVLVSHGIEVELTGIIPGIYQG